MRIMHVFFITGNQTLSNLQKTNEMEPLWKSSRNYCPQYLSTEPIVILLYFLIFFQKIALKSLGLAKAIPVFFALFSEKIPAKSIVRFLLSQYLFLLLNKAQLNLGEILLLIRLLRTHFKVMFFNDFSRNNKEALAKTCLILICI